MSSLPNRPHPGWRAALEWLPALALLLGVALQLRQYVFNRSLWLDEAYLVGGMAGRDMVQLLTQPLDNNQAAPLGFLVLTRMATMALGGSDWVFRLVPWLAEGAALGVAGLIGRRLFRHWAPRALLLALLGLSPVLVYYSSEFKQYTLDVLVMLALVWAALRFSMDRPAAGAWWLAGIGAAGIWLSHPSVFVLAAVGVVLGLTACARRCWPAVGWLVAVGLVWAVSFGASYVMSLRALSGNSALGGFWTHAYAPWPPLNVDDWRWYLDGALGLVYLALRHEGVAHHLAEPGWWDALNAVLLALTAVGLTVMARWQPRLAAILVLAVVVTLAASALKLYPFRSRLILFLAPLVPLALAYVLQAWLDRAGGAWWRWGAVVVAAGLLLVPGVPAARHWRAPYNDADIKSAMAHVRDHRQAGDHLMMSTWTHKAFDIYRASFGLDDLEVFAFRQTPNTRHDALATLRRICRSTPGGRTWLLISHRFGQRAGLLDILRSEAAVLSAFEGTGAGAYLFDFSGSPYCLRYRPAGTGAPRSGQAS